MAMIKVKMGEGIESNCYLSGKPVSAGETVEVSESDARYVVTRRLGEYVKEAAKPEAVEPVKDVKPEPEEKKAEKPEVKESEKQEEPPEDDDKPVSLEDMTFGQLKDLAEELGVKITKAKGRVLKADFIAAIRATKKGAKGAIK